jgi:hypothetical protein
MHTEEQARAKWCPHVRVSEDGARGVAHNTTLNIDTPNSIPQHIGTCIASLCMAWRWAESQEEYRPGYSEGGMKLLPPEGEGWKEHGGGWTRTREQRIGYCGLAGEP